MAWTISITAATSADESAIDAAKRKVLLEKHAIADGQHQLPDLEHVESWTKRAVIDLFENLLMHVPKNSCTAISLTASGGLRVEAFAVTAS